MIIIYCQTKTVIFNGCKNGDDESMVLFGIEGSNIVIHILYIHYRD